jgi:hypothetical protein
MFGTSSKRQPCRELGENHAGFDSLNEQASDTRTENDGLTLRSRGDPQRGGGWVRHNDQILRDTPSRFGRTRTQKGWVGPRQITAVP